MKNLQILPAETNSTTNWSGGKTSELFIYPKGSNLKDGDFSLRISIATVEVESSVFTPLTGVNRILMVLEGILKLEHEGFHSVELNPFDQDQFSGEWTTKSYGKVTDFNVMTKGSTKASVQKIDLTPNETLALTSAFDLQFIYVQSGSIEINENIILEKNAVVFDNINYSKLTANKQLEKTEIILVSVDFN